jgi:hypothetical protein
MKLVQLLILIFVNKDIIALADLPQTKEPDNALLVITVLREVLLDLHASQDTTVKVLE